MVKYRRRLSWRMIVFLLVVLLCVATFLLQRYSYNLLSTQTEKKQTLQSRVQNMHVEGALAGRSWPRETKDFNQTVFQTKIVLMYQFPRWYELKTGRTLFSDCSDSCILTMDGELIEEVDSVIIYSYNFVSKSMLGSSPNQIWVYFNVESPIYSNNEVFGTPIWHNRFNWTMTYRRDSDFYFGYGDMVRRKSTEPQKDFTALVKGKTKLVAWFVSNCETQSKRQEYVDELKKHIQVDIYGKCGDLECKKGKKECSDMITSDYFFYLSFENSLCKDYLTEKVYGMLKYVDVVPVVRGGSNYTALLPPNSFVDVSQFPSVNALADYLQKVAADKALYTSYLTWKNDWDIIEPVPFSFCQFCHRLHHADRWAKVYPNVDEWWRKDACYDPPPVV